MNKIFVVLTEPCTQNWDEMNPAEKGRFCMQCNKTVVDFTKSTDREIIRHLKKNKEVECCGRFRDDQLNHWLVDSGISKTNPALYSLLAGLLLLTASQNISAQSGSKGSIEILKYPVNPFNPSIKTPNKGPVNVTVSSGQHSVFENSNIRIGGVRTLSNGKDPMLVVDGAPAPLSFLSSIAPEDIANETLLKGATAAAIYGPEGANGVIIINTKRAETERKCILEEAKHSQDKQPNNGGANITL